MCNKRQMNAQNEKRLQVYVPKNSIMRQLMNYGDYAYDEPKSSFLYLISKPF